MKKSDKQALALVALVALGVWWRKRKATESGVLIDVTKTSGKGGSAHGESL